MRIYLVVFIVCLLLTGAIAQNSVIAWQAPQSSDTTNFNNFVSGVLPYISGIGGSSVTATGNVLGNVYWSDLDNCSSTAPCAPDSTCTSNCYDWANLDTDLMAYVNSTPFQSNGCVSGKCQILLVFEAQQDSGNSVTITPQYVYSSNWAAAAPGGPYPLQDTSACKQWPGQVTATWPGALPYSSGSFTTSNQGMVWNANACAAYGSGGPSCTCTTSCSFTNFSGFPVVYEKPFLLAYEQFMAAVIQHYSSSGKGNGPTIAPYISQIRFGLASGGENDPSDCMGAGTASNGIFSLPLWPGPQGLSAEPQGVTQCGYVNNWLGTLQYGMSCPSGSNDGDGYVLAVTKYLASLHSTIPITLSSHSGPPSNMVEPYADAEAAIFSAYKLGFGNEGGKIPDIFNWALGQTTTQDWVHTFQTYPSQPQYLTTTADGNSTPHAAQFNVTSITITGTTATLTCTGTTGSHCEVYQSGTVWLTGVISSNPAYSFNGIQTVTGSPGSGQFTFTTSIPSTVTGSGGYVYAPSFWPTLLPFMTQHFNKYVLLWECDLDYAFGTTTSNKACGGNPGPDTAWQQALTTFLTGKPAFTSSIVGKGAINGKGVIQ